MEVVFKFGLDVIILFVNETRKAFMHLEKSCISRFTQYKYFLKLLVVGSFVKKDTVKIKSLSEEDFE